MCAIHSMPEPNVERVCHALGHAFTTSSDLAFLAQSGLGIDLAAKINVAAGPHDQIFDLVRWARKTGQLTPLLAKAVQLRPDNAALADVYRDAAALGLDLGAVDDGEFLD